LLLAIRASRQAVKKSLGESDIQRALEIEWSFEKLILRLMLNAMPPVEY
jgi:hypothetical protein